MNLRKTLALLGCLSCFVLCLSGCSGGRSSDYADASVSVPETYAGYTEGIYSFRFEAGWKSVSWDETQDATDSQAKLLNTTNNMVLTNRLVSPARAVGTTDYLDFGYFLTGGTVKTKDLESIMTPMDELSASMKTLGLSCEELQQARIRSYNDAQVEALTYSYRVVNDKVTVVIQTALIAGNGRVYVISYADFTSKEDNDMLERLLSTLTISS